MVKAVWIPGGGSLDAVYDIRNKVFVIEQGFDPNTDRDDVDNVAWHALILDDDISCGTGRLYIDGEGRFSLGRICILREYRSRGLGDLLMRVMLFKALELGAEEVHLGSQVQAKGFYEKFGFVETGLLYDEEGVPHTHMAINASDINLHGSCGAAENN